MPRSRRLFDAWADLDPTGLSRRAVRAARVVPLVSEVERVAEDVERRVLAALRERVQEVLALPAASDPLPASVTAAELLTERLTQSTAGYGESRAREFARIVEQLCPDEARILAALSDRTLFAVVDVIAAGAIRRPNRVLLANASDVGRHAGVSFPERVPAYVTHLLALGIAELGPEDETMEARYEILDTEPRVQAARRLAEQTSRLPPTTVRQVLSLSELGAALWSAATAAPQ